MLYYTVTEVAETRRNNRTVQIKESQFTEFYPCSMNDSKKERRKKTTTRTTQKRQLTYPFRDMFMKPCRVHLCPEKHTMANMAKNCQKASDSNWMPKVATWRVAILAKMVIFGKIGENSPKMSS